MRSLRTLAAAASTAKLSLLDYWTDFKVGWTY